MKVCKRFINVRQLDTLCNHSGRSTSTYTCGTVGRAVVYTVASSGRLRGARKKLLKILTQELWIFARAILQHEGETSGSSHARYCRWGKGKRHPFRDLESS